MKYATVFRELQAMFRWRPAFGGLAHPPSRRQFMNGQFEPYLGNANCSGARTGPRDYKLDASAEKLVTRLATAFSSSATFRLGTRS